MSLGWKGEAPKTRFLTLVISLFFTSLFSQTVSLSFLALALLPEKDLPLPRI
jgi:hypothetical protein